MDGAAKMRCRRPGGRQRSGVAHVHGELSWGPAALNGPPLFQAVSALLRPVPAGRRPPPPTPCLLGCGWLSTALIQGARPVVGQGGRRTARAAVTEPAVGRQQPHGGFQPLRARPCALPDGAEIPEWPAPVGGVYARSRQTPSMVSFWEAHRGHREDVFLLQRQPLHAVEAGRRGRVARRARGREETVAANRRGHEQRPERLEPVVAGHPRRSVRGGATGVIWGNRPPAPPGAHIICGNDAVLGQTWAGDDALRPGGPKRPPGRRSAGAAREPRVRMPSYLFTGETATRWMGRPHPDRVGRPGCRRRPGGESGGLPLAHLGRQRRRRCRPPVCRGPAGRRAG